MKYRQFGVTTVIFVIFLSVWFAVSIVVAWSVPAVEVEQEYPGFCETNRADLIRVQTDLMRWPFGTIDVYNTIEFPYTWTKDEQHIYKWDRAEMAKKVFELQVRELKLIIERSCLQ